MNNALFYLGFEISVDNSIANSHNINIDRPTFFCFAKNEKEAVKKMLKSDFTHRNKKIVSINKF